MNILFLTLGYPEGNDTRGIYVDLINELIKRGNNVTVVTPLERREKRETFIYEKDNLKVLRVKSLNIQKTNIIEKGLSTLLIESTFIRSIKKYLCNEKYDLVLYSTPPITFEKVIRYIKNRDNAKSYLLLKDIFPQNAVDLGMMKENGLIHKFFRKKEEKLYDISDFIGCMSQANVDYIKMHNNLENKTIEICPNSITPSDNIELSKDEIVEIRKQNLIPEDKLILMYGGNLGKPQGIDFLIDILISNKLNEEVFFVICGNGTEYKKLEDSIRNNDIKNVKLNKALPKRDYDNLLKACDIGLIFLDKRFTIPNFPSRLLSYMDYSKPVIAATDRNTDIGEVIEQGVFGYWCESGDVDAFNLKLLGLIKNKHILNKMKMNARKYLEANYTSKDGANIILKRLTNKEWY